MLSVFAQAAQTPGQGPQMNMIWMMVIIFGIFYFLVFKPQKKEQQQHKNMLSELKKNDEVITSSGMHGTIVNVKDKTFILRIDDNVKIEIQKNSIAHLKKKREK